jgi:hypothetical protein
MLLDFTNVDLFLRMVFVCRVYWPFLLNDNELEKYALGSHAFHTQNNV